MWLEFEWLIQLERCFDRCELDCPSDLVHRADHLNTLTNTSVRRVGEDSPRHIVINQSTYYIHSTCNVVCGLYSNNSTSL